MGAQKKKKEFSTLFIRKWPRAVFDLVDKEVGRGSALVAKSLEVLSSPGVYVLYHDDQPYYVGKADRLRKRLYQHANSPNNRGYDRWNSFSAFVVNDDPNLMSYLEAVLIAAMPTQNSAKPKLQRVSMRSSVARIVKELRLAKQGIKPLGR